VHFEGVLRVERARCLIAPGVCIPVTSVVPREFQTADGCARARLTRNDLLERFVGRGVRLDGSPLRKRSDQCPLTMGFALQ